MANSTNIKYRVHLEVLRLKINKNIEFDTKIVWKRHQNKAETNSVKHSNGYSIFNQTLSLEFNMPYNESTQTYLEKKTEIVAIIVYQGKVKSGGYAKYNIADSLNSNPHGVSKVQIPMSQCPDPAAFIEVALSYERLSDEIQGDTMSVLNVSPRDLSMSRIDFHDDKLSMEMDRINETIKKFQALAIQVKQKTKNSSSKMPELLTELQLIKGQKQSLQNTVKKLEKQLKQKQQAIQQEKKKSRKQIDELQKQIEKKSKDMKNELEGKKQNVPNYQEMYEAAVKQIEELRSGEISLRKSMDFRIAGNLEDVRQIADLENSKVQEEYSEKVEDLSRQNVELQSQVASMSHKLAQLFNASYQFGGAKLLDYLQTSIGLTQTED